MRIVLDLEDVDFIVAAILVAANDEGVTKAQLEQLVNDWEDHEVDDLRRRIVTRAQPKLNKLLERFEVGE